MDNAILNHTMIRVSDRDKSLQFYKDILGMEEMSPGVLDKGSFILYFLGYPTTDSKERFASEGVLELTYNIPEDGASGPSIHHPPNQGFSHLCFLVKDYEATIQSLKDKGILVEHGILPGEKEACSYCKDPSGYTIAIKKGDENVLAYTTLRAANQAKTDYFYENLLKLKKVEGDECTSTFTYREEVFAGRLKFVFEEGLVIDNGNTEPHQHYGHIALTFTNIDKVCEYLESLESQINWRKRLLEGRMHNLAFITDPDTYSIEILAR